MSYDALYDITLKRRAQASLPNQVYFDEVLKALEELEKLQMACFEERTFPICKEQKDD